MARKQIESSKRNWKKAGRNLALGLLAVAVADQSGLLLRLADAAFQRTGVFAYHMAPDVQVRISPRICRFFSGVPTGVPMRAITLGRTIFVPGRGALPLSAEAAEHEAAHIRQWQEYGLIGFSISYAFWQVARGYEGNPFERDAGRLKPQFR
jgi:hypothetical protein